MDIINIVYDNGKLFIEYESAGPAKSTVYKYMVQAMKILDSYIREKKVEITEIRFKAIEWHYSDVYDITLTYDEMRKFLTGEYGFNEWVERVNITTGA